MSLPNSLRMRASASASKRSFRQYGADGRGRFLRAADIEIGAGQQHRAALGDRLPPAHHADDRRRVRLLANQRLFEAGLEQDLSRPVGEAPPRVGDHLRRDARIAAGGDQPVDDLGLDRVGDGIGGGGRGGIVAVVDELDRVAEPGRIAGRRRAERRGLGPGRNHRLEFGRRFDVAGLDGSVGVVDPVDEQIGDRIGVGHHRPGRVDALRIEPRQRDVGQRVERRFLGRRGARDRSNGQRRGRDGEHPPAPGRAMRRLRQIGSWRLQLHPSLSGRTTESGTGSARFRADLILP